MGSQICSNYQQKKFQNDKQLTAQNEHNQDISKVGEQNLIGQEDLDQCSPSSKFNVQFLNSSIRASQISYSICSQKNSLNDEKANSDNEVSTGPAQNNDTKQLLHSFSKIKVQKRKSRIFESGEFKFGELNKNERKIPKRRASLLNLKITGDFFYKLRQQPIQPYYQINKKIGEGSFGSVYIAKCKRTGQLRAIKILKQKFMEENDEKSLVSQISLLKKMDHINIIKLYDVFYIKGFFYVVTEFCQGGSLNQVLNKKQVKSEKDVAMFMKQIISAVSYMHKSKIAHRDLKLQNVVLVKKINQSKQKTCLKLIDFGLAQKVQFPLRNPSNIVGTLQFMAPEIFTGYFSTHSDVWSCGVIMCMLLVGFNPFNKKQLKPTIQSISKQEINFNKKQWSKVSQMGKNLLSEMLKKKPQKRISADQILSHQWFKIFQSQKYEIKNSKIILENFNKYHRGSNFMCFIKNFLISRQLSQAQRQQLALVFETIDTDSSGFLQKDELMKVYSLVAGTTDSQIQQIIQNIDQNKSGRIDFQQFLLCMTNDSIVQDQKYINEAFDYFDADNTGYIERKQLLDCLQGCNEAEIIKIISEADFNGDQKISKDQFTNFMMALK